MRSNSVVMYVTCTEIASISMPVHYVQYYLCEMLTDVIGILSNWQQSGVFRVLHLQLTFSKGIRNMLTICRQQVIFQDN